ncbi:hypothetical protein LHJ74_25320 [Streptomyces sp. N2-109]|uniref:Uncharacterized protein n=1 Tax=Streptomyces gossypii TaxID=2883101 RepID=A0ABT2JZQ3_9ACTN|nr:hypothetical protein [Streptomyces gossypii]MCT2593186.1 hypothetical protein [Streptomyces gossypii]
MSPSSSPAPRSSRLPVEEANAAIRAFVAGRAVWTPADLAELARLRQAWMDAASGRVRSEEAA